MMTMMGRSQEGCDLVAEVRLPEPARMARWAIRRTRLHGCMYYGGERYPCIVATDMVIPVAGGDGYALPIRLVGNRQIVNRMRPGDTFRARIGKDIIVGRVHRTGDGLEG